jgi:hypothetical protein
MLISPFTQTRHMNLAFYLAGNVTVSIASFFAGCFLPDPVSINSAVFEFE